MSGFKERFGARSDCAWALYRAVEAGQPAIWVARFAQLYDSLTA